MAASPSSKKGSATTWKKSAASVAASSSSNNKPSYLDMVKEALIHGVENGEKQGSSRKKIKSFMEQKYGVDAESATTKSALKKAVMKGVEEGELIMQNGPAGKVKLASKTALKKLQAERDEMEEQEMESDEKPSKSRSARAKANSSTSVKKTIKAK